MDFGRLDILDPEHLHLLLPHAPLRTEDTPAVYSEEPDPSPARQPSPFPSLRDTRSLPMLSPPSSRSYSRFSPDEVSVAGCRMAPIVIDGLDIGGAGSRVVSWGVRGDYGEYEGGSRAPGGEKGNAKEGDYVPANAQQPVCGFAGKGNGEDDDDGGEGS